MSDASKPSSGIKFWLHHVAKQTGRPWCVRWYPNGRRGGTRSKGFPSREERDAFVSDGFPKEVADERRTGKFRKPANRDREQREDPENWSDELTEVMAGVAEIRVTSGRRYSLLSDVYAAMKQLGFTRSS